MTKKLSIVTVVLECKSSESPTNRYRADILQKVLKTFGQKDIILLPARFYKVAALNSEEEASLTNNVRYMLRSANSDAIVCFGIDVFEKDDPENEQIAIAIDKSGIIAKGRKFTLDYNETTSNGKIATSYNSKEDGYDRYIKCKGKRLYMAICYDLFGVKKLEGADLNADIVLSLSHRFVRKGGGSGASRFARLGFGDASQQLKCPVFGSAVFFERAVPKDWPTGFIYTGREKSPTKICYADNNLQGHNPVNCFIATEYEKAVCHLYEV
jgi:hypothetical protein